MEDKGYKTLAYLWESRRTYDFEIKVGNRSFPAVRSVLENKSEYFRALFSSGMREVEDGVLNMFGVEADGVEQCMSFLHSGQVVLHSENIFETLAAAHLMQLGTVTSICFQFLHEHLNLDNYLTALRACDLYENATSKNRVRAFVVKRLRLVAKTEDFLSINKDDFVYCLQLSSQVKNAKFKWKIAARWIRSEATRQHFFQEIIQQISMQLVSEEFLLDTILEEPFVKMSPKSMYTVIEEWLSYSSVKKLISTKRYYRWRSILQTAGVDIYSHLFSNMFEMLEENITELSQQDEFVSLDECIILVAFESDRTKFSSERVKWKAAVKWIEGNKDRDYVFPELFNTMKFERLSPSFMRENIESFPLVKDFEECLEALKTFKARKEQQTATGLACVYQYGLNIMALHLNTKKWSILAKYETEDGIVGMVNILDDIYLMGSETLFKLSGNSKWTKLAAPPSGSWMAKIVAFRNRIYLFNCCCEMSGYFYDPCDNTWTKSSEMRQNWRCNCVASSDNFIWYVAGTSGYSKKASKYDPVNLSWTDIAAPIHTREYAAAAVLYEKLYLVGGKSWSHSAECYDPDTNTWTEISNLVHPRSHLSVCVVNDKLYAVGPMQGVLHDSVEVYDAEHDVWRFMRNLPGGRGYVRCCSTIGPFSRATKRRYPPCYSFSGKFPKFDDLG